MSDNNQDKPDDFEITFDGSLEPEQENGVEVEYQQSPFVDADADFSDIDDGDDDGIFAPDPVKEKGSKTSGLLGAVALLAVVGAGGYVYYSNPQMIDQVKQNILGSEVSSTEADTAAPAAVDTPPVTVSETTAPVENVPSAIQATEGNQNLNPSLASVVDDAHKLDEQAAIDPVPAPSPAPDVVVAVVPVPAADAIQTPNPASAENVAPPVEVVADVPPPLTEGSGVAVAGAPKMLNVPAAKKVDKSEAVPEKEEPKKEVKEEKPIIVASKDEQKVIADSKLDRYFDSPGGKILKEIPAPSMNPNKGKGESIIIVSKSAHKTSAKYGKSGPVSIEMNNQMDEKMVAANRAVLLGRYDAAKDMYDELYKLNPKDSRVLMGRAVLFQKMGDVEQASSAYEEVLKYNPDNAEAIVNLAGLIRKQYPAVALNKLLDLHQQYPNNAVVVAQLGVAYADSGNYTDAFHYLSMAASIEPTNPQHFYNMAVVAEKAGDPAKAIQNYEKALEVDAISGAGSKAISRDTIYDRLTRLRGN